MKVLILVSLLLCVPALAAAQTRARADVNLAPQTTAQDQNR